MCKLGQNEIVAEPPTPAEQAAVRKRVAEIEKTEREKIRAGIKGEVQRKAATRRPARVSHTPYGQTRKLSEIRQKYGL